MELAWFLKNILLVEAYVTLSIAVLCFGRIRRDKRRLKINRCGDFTPPRRSDAFSILTHVRSLDLIDNLSQL